MQLQWGPLMHDQHKGAIITNWEYLLVLQVTLIKWVMLVHFNISLSTEFHLFTHFLWSTLFQLLTHDFCLENIFQLADDAILTGAPGVFATRLKLVFYDLYDQI